MDTTIIITQSDGRPMYLQIMEQIKQKIAVGDWAPGEEIPSIRALAIAIRVSVITAKRAYLELEREGVIHTQHGKGSFVAPDPGLGARLFEQQFEENLKQVVHFGALLGLDSDQIVLRLRENAAQHNKNEESLARETV